MECLFRWREWQEGSDNDDKPEEGAPVGRDPAAKRFDDDKNEGGQDGGLKGEVEQSEEPTGCAAKEEGHIFV